MHDSNVARKLDALTSEIREVRRIVTKLLDAQTTKDPTIDGVRQLPDGSTFVPGTGRLGQRALSGEAQAALDELDRSEA